MTKKTRNYLIGGIVAVVAVGLAILIAALNFEPTPTDEYFRSNEDKIVMTSTPDATSFVAEELEPEYTHVVFYVGDGEVKNAKIYFQYTDEVAAKAAAGEIKVADLDWAKSKKVNGKFIIFQAVPELYEGYTAEEVRTLVSNMQAAGAAIDYYDIISEETNEGE